MYLYTHVKDHIEKLEQEERKQQETKENFEKGIDIIENVCYNGKKYAGGLHMSIDILQDKIRKMKNPTMVDLALCAWDLPPHLLEAAGSEAKAYGIIDEIVE